MFAPPPPSDALPLSVRRPLPPPSELFAPALTQPAVLLGFALGGPPDAPWAHSALVSVSPAVDEAQPPVLRWALLLPEFRFTLRVCIAFDAVAERPGGYRSGGSDEPPPQLSFAQRDAFNGVARGRLREAVFRSRAAAELVHNLHWTYAFGVTTHPFTKGDDLVSSDDEEKDNDGSGDENGSGSDDESGRHKKRFRVAPVKSDRSERRTAVRERLERDDEPVAEWRYQEAARIASNNRAAYGSVSDAFYRITQVVCVASEGAALPTLRAELQCVHYPAWQWAARRFARRGGHAVYIKTERADALRLAAPGVKPVLRCVALASASAPMPHVVAASAASRKARGGGSAPGDALSVLDTPGALNDDLAAQLGLWGPMATGGGTWSGSVRVITAQPGDLTPLKTPTARGACLWLMAPGRCLAGARSDAPWPPIAAGAQSPLLAQSLPEQAPLLELDAITGASPVYRLGGAARWRLVATMSSHDTRALSGGGGDAKGKKKKKTKAQAHNKRVARPDAAATVSALLARQAATGAPKRPRPVELAADTGGGSAHKKPRRGTDDTTQTTITALFRARAAVAGETMT